jgi:hypothetical protein
MVGGRWTPLLLLLLLLLLVLLLLLILVLLLLLLLLLLPLPRCAGPAGRCWDNVSVGCAGCARQATITRFAPKGHTKLSAAAKHSACDGSGPPRA